MGPLNCIINLASCLFTQLDAEYNIQGSQSQKQLALALGDALVRGTAPSAHARWCQYIAPAANTCTLPHLPLACRRPLLPYIHDQGDATSPDGGTSSTGHLRGHKGACACVGVCGGGGRKTQELPNLHTQLHSSVKDLNSCTLSIQIVTLKEVQCKLDGTVMCKDAIGDYMSHI